MKLSNYAEIKGQILCETGLKIGGTKETMGIGETDNPIVRHPVTHLPYIPGSSLKGKMRSLLEMKYSPYSQSSGKPCNCAKCDVCKLFGCGDPNNRDVQSFIEPTRLIFRDSYLNEKSKNELENSVPGTYAEVKTEIAMDRKSGKAARGALRQQERIPEGTLFDFTLSVRIFAEDSDEKKNGFKAKLAEGFELLQQDYLGGNGSRGYGKVRITSNGKPISDYIRDMSW